MNNEYSDTFKILTIGDTCVGKTSLLYRSQENIFRADTKNTIGIDFTQRDLERNYKKYKLYIWDTAGQERFKSVTRAYYRDAHAAFLVFDLTNPESLQNIRTWYKDLMNKFNYNGNSSKPIVLLIGNKSDLTKTVKHSDIIELVDELKIPIYLNTSAKTGEHVDDMFESLLDLLITNNNINILVNKFFIFNYLLQI